MLHEMATGAASAVLTLHTMLPEGTQWLDAMSAHGHSARLTTRRARTLLRGLARYVQAARRLAEPQVPPTGRNLPAGGCSAAAQRQQRVLAQRIRHPARQPAGQHLDACDTRTGA